MDTKIAIITPFAAMQQIAQEVVNERSDEWPEGIQVVMGDLGDGLQQAYKAIAQGAEVIISRGGTASLISSQIELPVVEIQVTAFDILRALKQVSGQTKKVGVAGFRNVIYGCEDFGELWGIALQEITLENEQGALEKIMAAKNQGINVIIGDAISIKLAGQYGLQGILIQSGKDAIYKAIKQAQQIGRVRSKEQARSELLRTIINSSTDGILAVDEQSRITILNPIAEDVFHLRAEEALGRKVSDVIPSTRLPSIVACGTAEIGEIQKIGNRVIATKRVPIKLSGKVVGAIANFQDVTQLQRYEQHVRQKLYAKGLVAKFTLAQVIGSSTVMADIKKRAVQYAGTDSTVLITGESGTGKELLAQSIHNLGQRSSGPFVAVNCAALPENLLESELFGYEEGAFTGAKKGGKAGLCELAHGGTLFLDEVGEMPLALQARLLRVLQEKEVMRLGGDSVIPVDIRIIAATNQDLLQLIQERRFRNDLYYRLDILRLHVPPLRERKEDIPLLVDYFLHKHTMAKPNSVAFSDAAIDSLKQYQWPGNVRELANILERTLLLFEGPIITEEIIGTVLRETAGRGFNPAAGETLLKVREMETIRTVLQEENYNYSRAAERLGINRTTLWRKLRQQDTN